MKVKYTTGSGVEMSQRSYSRQKRDQMEVSFVQNEEFEVSPLMRDYIN